MFGQRFFFTSVATIALVGLFAADGAGAGNQTTVQGVLMDKECSSKAETRLVPGPNPHLEGGIIWAYTHTKQCLQMQACQRSGYGVVAFESVKFLTFDAAGNQKAAALLAGAKKQEDFRIEVTGEVDGDKIKVTDLKLLP